MKEIFLQQIIILISIASGLSCKCYTPFDEKVGEVIHSPIPHKYIQTKSLPSSFDWRSVNGTNYASRVITQQSPAVCGSCWAEAATGALSDRYIIATGAKLRIQLAPQQLINFNLRISGGSCNGGDDLKAYQFIHKYGISDDTCAPFIGLNWAHGFEVAAYTEVSDVQSHQCYKCTWSGECGFVPRENFNLYGVDEFGSVLGEEQMMAEIYARGPISCRVNSDAAQFNVYRGGVISCNAGSECQRTDTDHVVVIAGWGVDKKSGKKHWVGRNSYGTQWGEGSGGGWFRLERGSNTLNIESHHCYWATPAAADVSRALRQHEESIAAALS